MALLVGVSGIPASGKTLLGKILSKHLPKAGFLSQDHFYKGTSGQDPATYNFDTLEALDLPLMRRTLRQAKAGHFPLKVPEYNFVTHQPQGHWQLNTCDILIVEGHLFALDEEMAQLLDVLCVVKIDWDLALARRLERDVAERGRDLADVLLRFRNHARPWFPIIEALTTGADYIIENNQDIATFEHQAQNIATQLSQKLGVTHESCPSS